RILKRSGFARVIESRSRTHFLECVQRFYESDLPYLLVWGGDGTAHDAINTLVKAEAAGNGGAVKQKKAVGFLRGGSGNGIQDSYEVPFSLKGQLSAYAESVTRNYVEEVDLFAVTELSSRKNGDVKPPEYGQLTGLGFDAQVLRRRNSKTCRRGTHAGNPRPGLLNYVRAGLETFFDDLPEQQFTLELMDGKYAFRGYRVNAEFPFDLLNRTTRVSMLEVGTRPYYGKLFKVCPDVVCNDGYLDLYLYNFRDKASAAKNAILLWQGNHAKINKKLIKKGRPVIERYEIRSVHIRSREAFDYHIDGELKTAAEDGSGGFGLKIEVCPKAIRFLVPGTFYRKFHPDFTD
ncbi:MAG: diacylglycerol/lipid kinase family protein, partial [Spirochaeta sp.]